MLRSAVPRRGARQRQRDAAIEHAASSACNSARSGRQASAAPSDSASRSPREHTLTNPPWRADQIERVVRGWRAPLRSLSSPIGRMYVRPSSRSSATSRGSSGRARSPLGCLRDSGSDVEHGSATASAESPAGQQRQHARLAGASRPGGRRGNRGRRELHAGSVAATAADRPEPRLCRPSRRADRLGRSQRQRRAPSAGRPVGASGHNRQLALLVVGDGLAERALARVTTVASNAAWPTPTATAAVHSRARPRARQSASRLPVAAHSRIGQSARAAARAWKASAGVGASDPSARTNAAARPRSRTPSAARAEAVPRCARLARSSDPPRPARTARARGQPRPPRSEAIRTVQGAPAPARLVRRRQAAGVGRGECLGRTTFTRRPPRRRPGAPAGRARAARSFRAPPAPPSASGRRFPPRARLARAAPPRTARRSRAAARARRGDRERPSGGEPKRERAPRSIAKPPA